MIIRADGRHLPLADGCVDAIVTSPPYFGLRAYATGGAKAAEIGTEASVEAYVAALVECAREWRRVLKPTGVVWLNLGDSYAATAAGGGNNPSASSTLTTNGGKGPKPGDKFSATRGGGGERRRINPGVESGQLLMVPARVALALQADGWIVRSDVVWAKRNAMPESVAGWRWERCRVKVRSLRRGNNRAPDGVLSMAGELTGGARPEGGGGFGLSHAAAAEWQPCPGCNRCRSTGGMVLRRGSWRPTRAHEAVFMLAKSPRYFADGEAVRVAHQHPNVAHQAPTPEKATAAFHGNPPSNYGRAGNSPSGANLRDVWRLASKPAAFDFCARCRTFYAGPGRPKRTDGVKACPTCRAPGDWVDHFALMPPRLAELCIRTTPERVCSKCGAPWAREVEREPMVIARSDLGERVGNRTYSSGTMVAPATSRTLGHRPTCACAAPARAPLILDPFAGGGTTGAVARALGRRFVGVDLSHRYALLARARVAHAEAHPALYLHRERAASPRLDAPLPGQLSLFGT